MWRQLENLDFFPSLTSKENTIAPTKEFLLDSGIERAQESVWEVNNYLNYTENKIHIFEKDDIPLRAGIEKIKQSINLGHGSGFFISPTKMVTNFHVIHNANENTKVIVSKDLKKARVEKTKLPNNLQNLSLELCDFKSLDYKPHSSIPCVSPYAQIYTLSQKMKLIKASALYDLALLESETEVEDYIEIKPQFVDPRRDSFFLIGYPDKRFLYSFINYHESLWDNRILSFYRDAELGNLKGSSGGPIIDQNGLVAGVSYAGTEDLIIAVSNTALDNFLTNKDFDCSQLSKTDCIHKELISLEKLANEEGDEFAKYKIQFNGNYKNLLRKRIAFQKLINAIEDLNQRKTALIDSLNRLSQHPTKENRNHYENTYEEYKQQTQTYNQAVEELNALIRL